MLQTDYLLIEEQSWNCAIQQLILLDLLSNMQHRNSYNIIMQDMYNACSLWPNFIIYIDKASTKPNNIHHRVLSECKSRDFGLHKQLCMTIIIHSLGAFSMQLDFKRYNPLL